MQRENEVQHVFLVGAKSLGAYGGYETFVYNPFQSRDFLVCLSHSLP